MDMCDLHTDMYVCDLHTDMYVCDLHNDMYVCVAAACPRNCYSCTYDNEKAEAECVIHKCDTGYTEVSGHCQGT